MVSTCFQLLQPIKAHEKKISKQKKTWFLDVSITATGKDHQKKTGFGMFLVVQLVKAHAKKHGFQIFLVTFPTSNEANDSKNVDLRRTQSGYNDIEAIRLWKCGDGDKVGTADFTRTEVGCLSLTLIYFNFNGLSQCQLSY